MPGPEEALKRARSFASDSGSLVSMAEEFANQYGLDVQPELESAPFAFHDGGHRYGNLPATLYGELLQNRFDKAAFAKLYGTGEIQGNPANYIPSGIASSPRSAFVNFGSMPEVDRYEDFKNRSIAGGARAEDFAEGSGHSWNEEVARRIGEREGEMDRLVKISNKKFKEKDYSFFQGAGLYDPEQGFMPTPDLRNSNSVALEDLREAGRRGERFAGELMEGYRNAVAGGSYAPSRPVLQGAVHAADLSDAGMGGALKVGRGWAEEGIFPYKDPVAQLSNPPALLRKADPWSQEIAVQMAEEAREGRALGRVQNAIRFGFNTTTDIAGSVPLFDPDFRAAVERNDLAGAAKRALTDYAAGVVAAPVGGAVTGAVQRAAPAVSARVLPAVAGAVRVGNPVAVASQLGGDARQSAAARIADSQAAVRQQNLAEQARQRGSRWSIPTPWGRVGVPELGISESGGLFLGGRQQTRPLGSTATLGGRPVVWAGPEYGWQSEASARKLGVRAR